MPAPPMADPVSVRLWDGPVRVVHWALVLLLGFSWWTAETGRMEWHRYSGLLVLALLVFRIYWGFAGAGAARFASFVRGPATVATYIRTLGSRTGSAAPGHNPLGALSVLAILLALAIQVITGLFAVDIDGLESGNLSHWVSFETGRVAASIHELSFAALQILAITHVAAVVFYLVWKRTNLISPMITGRGRLATDPVYPRAPVWRLVLGAVAAFALMAWVSKGMPPLQF